MKLGARRLTSYAVMIAVALCLAVLENSLPVALIPIPGIKIGLANIVTLFAIYSFGAFPALIISICRILLASIFGSGVSAFVFSLFGGLLSLAVMLALKPFDGRFLSIFGISVAGACAHSVGQICAAMLMLSPAAFSYLPVLLLCSVPTGLIIALISEILIKRLKPIIP